MAKKVMKIIRLQISAGKANPAPPIGPALGSAGVNIMDFCKKFNAETQGSGGDILPTIITVYQDKSFTFEMRKPPVAEFIKKASGVEKGSATPNRLKVGKLSESQAHRIAQEKVQDMSTVGLEAAVKCVIGTARSMGIEMVEG